MISSPYSRMTGCTVDYPLYGITQVDAFRVALVGGGGSMKSGVPNIVLNTARPVVNPGPSHSQSLMLEVYDMRGNGMVLAHRYDCGTEAPTCISAHPGDPILVAGVDNNIQILQIPMEKKLNKEMPSLRKTFERDVVKTTDYGEIVKGITFCCFGEKLVTVGEDKAITIWEFPSMTKRWRITQHLSEVTQVTAHPNGEPYIVTATRGSECMLWDVETGERVHQLKYEDGTNTKFRFRSIRYSPTGESLYALILPVAWSPSSFSNIVKFDSESWTIQTKTYMRGEPLAELAISGDDSLLATASSNGHIYIYDAGSLSIRRRMFDVHGLFVTGLCFIPENGKSDSFKLLSISADKECKVHNPHLADPIRFLKAVVYLCLLVLSLYIFFSLLQRLDLVPQIDDFEEGSPQDHQEQHHHDHHREL